MKLDIITPESEIYSGEASAVSLPGKDGAFQILNNHAPIISALTKGVVYVDLNEPLNEDQKNDSIEIDSSERISIKIKGGVAELTNNKLIVLAE